LAEADDEDEDADELWVVVAGPEYVPGCGAFPELWARVGSGGGLHCPPAHPSTMHIVSRDTFHVPSTSLA
jgi:hypothetical protein